MARLEDLTKDSLVRGILPDQAVTVVDVRWYGSACVELTYKDVTGRPASELLYRDKEPTLSIVTEGRPWSFDGDGSVFRLVSEAYRIKLAHLFDPMLAVQTSLIEPLPHQITAVYGEMLGRQPLRFLLADDPGAGKTIMTGLFLKELLIRGDLKRCLICTPGSLVEQWQDELYRRFHLPFDILSREMLEGARSGNPFHERSLLICRMDQLARSDELLAKLEQTDWDVVVVDEAHKMSASFFGGEVRMTKRYHLGILLGRLTRHFLLLTATPHNGKEEEFQLFMALLDADRFEGRFRSGVHTADVSDLMRRMVKEQLVKFDGRPLFPERRAYTVNYRLSDMEARLYHDVTEYVREEMNRADRLGQMGQGSRGNRVGFALTILQRRLASSPEAIYQSLKRRRERLEKRLREEEVLRRGAAVAIPDYDDSGFSPDTEDIDEFYDESPSEEVEEVEDRLVDQASAAATIRELQAEIATLQRLEGLASSVLQADADRKWEELSGLLQGSGEGETPNILTDVHGHKRKLIIFTEHRDTLNYLARRIISLIGRPEAVVTIHGGLGRETRRNIQEAFTQDKEVQVLVATDAAGEGINLQRAHLMVNYDLPWNPNRIEQRFGRIHRIGQTEVCHLWNLVAPETREGDVFQRLLTKLEKMRESLGGSVFDVMGQSFTERRLRDMLVDAIRYGDQPEVRARLEEVIDRTLDQEKLRALIEERALAHETLSPADVERIRDDMERAEARRLQPHYIASFFREALEHLGGQMHEREPRRYEITHVPALIRQRDRLSGTGEFVQRRYERITFDRHQISLPGRVLASFVCPGHPLLEATSDLILERFRENLKRGAVLVNPEDDGEEISALLYLEHSIQDGRTNPDGSRRVVSKRLQFVARSATGEVSDAGCAPYLDFRSLTEHEREQVAVRLEASWVSAALEVEAQGYAAAHLVPEHLAEVKRRREPLVVKTMAAVKDRLTKEINHWDYRAEELKVQELAGKRMARINSGLARQRADELQARLQHRMEELKLELSLSPLPPLVIGGALVVPQGVLDRLSGKSSDTGADQESRKRVDRLAVAAVMEMERELGRFPREMDHSHPGYDIESKDPRTGRLLFIEVKGKAVGRDIVTVSRNQILTALNKPDDWVLAIATVDGDRVPGLRYLRGPFAEAPGFAVTSVNYDLNELWRMGTDPRAFCVGEDLALATEALPASGYLIPAE